MTKAKNGTATAAGACCVMIARTPESPASLGSIVGRSKPNNPSKTIGSVTPTIGHQVTARTELVAGGDSEGGQAHGDQQGRSPTGDITPRTQGPPQSYPPPLAPPRP